MLVYCVRCVVCYCETPITNSTFVVFFMLLNLMFMISTIDIRYNLHFSMSVILIQ